MAKVVLKWQEEDFDFDLLAISAHLKDYRLCWLLNSSLGLDLQRDADYELKNEAGTALFSFFSFTDEENDVSIYLLANRSENGMLIPEKKQTDYFLLIKNDLGETYADLSSKIKTLPNILVVQAVDPNTLKSKNNLLF